MAWSREGTLRRVDSAPAEAELISQWPTADHVALERTLLAWEEAQRPTRDQEPRGAYDSPSLLGEHLVLLPRPEPWTVPAYVHYWGAGADRTEPLIRALRSWFERCGAVIWATTNVTLHLHISDPITYLDEAFTIAAEQTRYARSNGSLRDHARSLLHARFWELFDRP